MISHTWQCFSNTILFKEVYKLFSKELLETVFFMETKKKSVIIGFLTIRTSTHLLFAAYSFSYKIYMVLRDVLEWVNVASSACLVILSAFGQVESVKLRY